MQPHSPCPLASTLKGATIRHLTSDDYYVNQILHIYDFISQLDLEPKAPIAKGFEFHSEFICKILRSIYCVMHGPARRHAK